MEYWQRRKKQNEQNGMSAIIANVTGDGSGGGGADLGAASVAAVAAAAIAVAPAIAAGPKHGRSRSSQNTNNNRTQDIGTGFVNAPGSTADPLEASHDDRRRSEPEQIEMSHTVHELTEHHPLTLGSGLESDKIKHNPGRLYNHTSGPAQVHKSQAHLRKSLHTEAHGLSYLLSDYDPRSGGEQTPPLHRHLDDTMEHGYARIKSSQAHSTTHEKHKPPAYTNL